ncbi:MAG TPA: beta-propeller domain-containing protein [Pyrinomonadaceae bacterium]|nr:beta-propeller domain-containing protein [Pyrinomonadaceae bacterium]
MARTFSIAAAIMVFAVSALIFSSSRQGEIAIDPPSEPEVPIEPTGKPRRSMRAFSSEQELRDYFRAWSEKRRRDLERRSASGSDSSGNTSSMAASPSAAKTAKEADDSVTNNQHAGVDEGGIVKLHGDHLVILRRGRLFTVKIGDQTLRPVDSVDAFAPGVDPKSDWYDEMLVAGNTVAVVGYSYRRGGTEINLFNIDELGGLSYRSTYHLRSNDYYSSRNYASRLIGSKLIFYTPMYIGFGGDPMERLPAVRKWTDGSGEFKPIVQPTTIYRAERPIESAYSMAMHTVTICDLASREFACKATATLGAPGRVFYVSPSSVYVWTTDWNYHGGKSASSSILYKMPLDGSAPSAVGVAGSPVDQFSFLESQDKHLNVLVRSDGRGEQMWGSEFAAGEVALFRLPVDSFSDGSLDAPRYRYNELPKPEGYTFQNRFVGNYLLYGTGSGWGRPQNRNSADLFAVEWATGRVSELKLKHGVDRIEQMSGDAVVVGTNGSDLYFSPVRLGNSPQVRESYVRPNASQGELRSHGFFYKPDGENSGLLGLPVAREGRAGYRHLVEGSAAILFLRNNGLAFHELGEMASGNVSVSDGCRASCVDWYGNARPLFVRDRVFALLGYEIVEGSVANGRIQEKRRINYSPRNRGRSTEE